jgi:Putative 2OG-Fe(II) oxygenase
MSIHFENSSDTDYNHSDFFGTLFSDHEQDSPDEVTQESEFDNEPFLEDSDPSMPPCYLLTAILAGLYEIPPMHVLRHQIGWGRRVRYDPNKLQCIQLDFQPIRTYLSLGANDASIVLEHMKLERFIHDLQQEKLCRASFFIYRAQIQNSTYLNDELRHLAMQEQCSNPKGIDVSNAGGGWHGNPSFFYQYASSDCTKQLYHICVQTIQEIEKLQPNPTRLQLEPNDVESWINISQNGSWNRLHTHEGSAWSGVYYIDDGNYARSQHYGGRLVLKPTAHLREDTYRMKKWERDRIAVLSDSSQPLIVDQSACEYLEIDPTPGHFIIFPGWLHHCVLPLNHLENDSRRISIAFNINSYESGG